MNSDDRTVPLAITMGDASGVGPEILLRVFNEGTLCKDVVVYGDRAILEAGSKLLGFDLQPHSIAEPSEFVPNALNVIDMGLLRVDQWTPAQLSSQAGQAAYQYVVAATEAALQDQVSAVVTLPMNKEATQRTYSQFTGHTELLAHLCGVEHVSMMLATDEVCVSHVSTHVSLKQAIELLTEERLSSTIRITHETLSKAFGQPRIGVCGLNPHAGESGMFGSEELTIIGPAIKQLRSEGIDVKGPFPADTVFRQAIVLDQFDALICMYHDQGHAPMKLHAFDTAVNITLGLPIIRTSVDHGTAFDIAWQGQASTRSLIHAIEYAQRLA